MESKSRRKLILTAGLGLLLACFLLVAAAVLAARWAWSTGRLNRLLPPPKTAETPAALASQDTPSGPTPADPLPVNHSALVLSAKETSEDSQSPRYSIKARWPHIEWGNDPRVAPFNQASDAMIEQEIQSFKENASQVLNEPGLGDLASDLNIDFAPTMTQDGILSILLRVAFYNAGAAHPGSYSRVLNSDLRSGKELALQNLFKPGSKYLEVISAACLEDLKARGVLGWEDGALPKPENYQSWNITPDGLLITFDEYQVAPYAAGPQSVTIAYSKLAEIIRPDGPLSALVSKNRSSDK